MTIQSFPTALFSLFLYLCFNTTTLQANSGLPINELKSSRTIETPLSNETGEVDSLQSILGHCLAITKADTNCLTHTVELSAFVYYVFSGSSVPLVVDWSNGQTAHKITVNAPGVWEWDPSATGCEPNHWDTKYILSDSFFMGVLSIQGPANICNSDTAALIVESDGYNFPNFAWSPANPSGDLSPYQTNAAGTYTLSVTDALGCAFSAQTTLLSSGIILNAAEQFFCPGDSIVIAGTIYMQSAIVSETIPSTTGGCDTILNHKLTFLTNPTRTENIHLCPGESVTIGGQSYNQSGIVTGAVVDPQGGCDVIVTYNIQLQGPAPSTVSIICPNSVVQYLPTGSGSVITYALPTAASDCPCPGLPVTLTSGLPSGNNFPDGVTTVSYSATDICGQSATCSFNVAILDLNQACDIKENGCIKYELLTITEDAAKNRTYRIRVTNSCASPLIYTAIQIPNGLVAMEPPMFSLYTAPSGNQYRVRSPNQSPFYSIRYTSLTDSIRNGESDIFQYTLPAQADVTFIHILSKLAPNVYLEAHMNTFYCPVEAVFSEEPIERGAAAFEHPANQALHLFPNPANASVSLETGDETGQLHLYDATGRLVLSQLIQGSKATFSVETIPQGLYQVVLLGENATRYGTLVIQR